MWRWCSNCRRALKPLADRAKPAIFKSALFDSAPRQFVAIAPALEMC